MHRRPWSPGHSGAFASPGPLRHRLAVASRLFLRTETRAVIWPGPASVAASSGPFPRSAPPPAGLGAYVARIRSGVDRFVAPVRERVLPDGAVHLLVDLGDAPGLRVVGSASAPADIELRGTVVHLGAQLRPGAIAAVLGVPAAEVTGREVPLDALWGAAAARALLDRLAEAPHAERPALLGALLLERLRATDPAPPDARARAAAEHVLAHGGLQRVSEVAAAVGVGERRLEQLFHQHVGLSPKALSRVARFRRTVDFVHQRSDASAAVRASSWADAAAACGFSDQAHLTHEFRALAGLPPTGLDDFGSFQDHPDDAG